MKKSNGSDSSSPPPPSSCRTKFNSPKLVAPSYTKLWKYERERESSLRVKQQHIHIHPDENEGEENVCDQLLWSSIHFSFIVVICNYKVKVRFGSHFNRLVLNLLRFHWFSQFRFPAVTLVLSHSSHSCECKVSFRARYKDRQSLAFAPVCDVFFRRLRERKWRLSRVNTFAKS